MMKTKSGQIFPNESGNGTVNLMDTKIRYAENHSASFSEVHIDDLQYIYIVVTENNKSLLFLFDPNFWEVS